MPQELDAVLIGTGQAAPALAGRLTAAGAKIAVVERASFGGSCVNHGCTPTKAWVASARAARFARRAADYGVVLDGPVRVDMKKVKARKDELVRSSTKGVEKSLRGMDGCTVYTGHARLEDARTVRVGDDVLRAQRVFLNVGTRPARPPIEGLDEVEVLDNAGILALEELPAHLVVIGGGYIGVEFGQMFRRFGSEVTILQRAAHLLPNEDERVSEEVRAILEAEGVRVRTGTECLRLRPHADGVEAGVACDEEEEATTVVGSHVLLAVGRTPNTDDLGLDAAGVEVDERGFVETDGRLESSVPGIFALGDCNGRGAFTHTAYNDFEIVAANLLDGEERSADDRIPCYAVYLDPPLARVGMNDRQAAASGRKVLVAHRPMTKVARAREMGETQGFLRLLVDADTERLLGASLLGVGCDEVVHALIDVMTADAPYTVVRRAVHVHPTVAELLPTALEDLEPLE